MKFNKIVLIVTSIVVVGFVTMSFIFNQEESITTVDETEVVIQSSHSGCQSPAQKVKFALSHGHCNLTFTGYLTSLKAEYMSNLNFANGKSTENGWSSMKVNFKINTRTFNCGDEDGKLTEGLLEKDMFNGDGNNYISFETVDVFMLSENWFQLRGNLKIKDQVQPIRFNANPIFKDGKLTSLVIDGNIDLYQYGIQSDNTEEEASRWLMMNLVIDSNDIEVKPWENKNGC